MDHYWTCISGDETNVCRNVPLVIPKPSDIRKLRKLLKQEKRKTLWRKKRQAETDVVSEPFFPNKGKSFITYNTITILLIVIESSLK